MNLKKLLPFLGLVLLFSCKSFVPSKDTAQLQSLQSVQLQADNMYVAMSQGNRQYVTYADTYQSISDQLDSITARDQARSNGKALVSEDLILVKGFATRWGYHKGKGFLTDKQVGVEKSYMDSYFDPRLRSELSLK